MSLSYCQSRCLASLLSVEFGVAVSVLMSWTQNLLLLFHTSSAHATCVAVVMLHGSEEAMQEFWLCLESGLHDVATVFTTHTALGASADEEWTRECL